MKSRRKFKSGVGAFCCCLVLMMAFSVHAASAIKVGIVLPLTGKLAKFGEIEKLSFELALQEINAAGGIHGRPLEFLIEDTTGRPDIGRSAVENLILVFGG